MTKTVAIYSDVHSIIVKKQRDIYEKHRTNIRITDIVTAVLRNYVDKTEELFSLGNYTSSNKINVTETQSTKNVIIHDDAHMLIVKKRMDIYEKYNTNLKISDMVSMILKNYIDKVEELFSLGEYSVPKINYIKDGIKVKAGDKVAL